MAAASSHNATKPVLAYEEAGKPIRLVYDTWTPRPHFIAVQSQPTQNATDTELQVAYEIIGGFLRTNPQFDKEAILSFHCGKWYQQHTSEWHAHLCVPEQPYFEKATVEIKQIPSNKEWGKVTTVADGMKNWQRKKAKNYEDYKNECVNKGTPKQTSVENCLLSTFDSNSQEFQLVWTYPAPRIGIVARSPSTSTLGSLYKFMSTVRSDAENKLKKCDANFTNFGCHICLYVCGQSGTSVTCRQGQVLTGNGQVNGNPNIVGYIQMDESQYVQWLPSELRQVWLNGFKEAVHFVRT